MISNKNKGRLSKFLIISGLKPTINRKFTSPFKKGIVVFSADFEMAWAFRYSKTKKNQAVEMGLKERKNIPVLLNLFDIYQIPVTWATVGHLFLNECNQDGKALPHGEMPRPQFFENRNWIFNTGDWYSHDPCTNFRSDPAWYAPDLIDMILHTKIQHEVACHTFSHLDFTYKNCTKELADAELDACINLAAKKNITLRSMAFPGGTFGNYESLKGKGILCYRKPMKYHIDLPCFDSHGLIIIPSSLSLDKDPYGWSKEFHLQRIKKFLEKTAQYKLVCHFWFHPSMDSWFLSNVLPDILKIVSDYRYSNKIEILTMNQVANKYSQSNDQLSYSD